jgi:hypothetical protein
MSLWHCKNHGLTGPESCCGSACHVTCAEVHETFRPYGSPESGPTTITICESHEMPDVEYPNWRNKRKSWSRSVGLPRRDKRKAKAARAARRRNRRRRR